MHDEEQVAMAVHHAIMSMIAFTVTPYTFNKSLRCSPDLEVLSISKNTAADVLSSG